MAAALQQLPAYSEPAVATVLPVQQNQKKQNQTDWLQQLAALPAQTIYANERLYWLTQLRQHFASQIYNQAHYQKMLILAQRIADWIMVIDITAEMQQNPNIVLHEQELVNLIDLQTEAYLQLGDLENTKALLQKTLFHFYKNQLLWEFYDWLISKEQSVKDLAFPMQTFVERTPTSEGACDLFLTPLEAHHLDAFRWVYINQFSDNEKSKSVAELCNLPVFESDQHWWNWQAVIYAQHNHYVFAVIHQEWGFIGSVCLEVSNGVGFFIIGLGRTFRVTDLARNPYRYYSAWELNKKPCIVVIPRPMKRI